MLASKKKTNPIPAKTRTVGSSLNVPCQVVHLFLLKTSAWFFPICPAEDKKCQSHFSHCIHSSAYWSANLPLVSDPQSPVQPGGRMLCDYLRPSWGSCYCSGSWRSAWNLSTHLLPGPELVSPHRVVLWAAPAHAELPQMSPHWALWRFAWTFFPDVHCLLFLGICLMFAVIFAHPTELQLVKQLFCLRV